MLHSNSRCCMFPLILLVSKSDFQVIMPQETTASSLTVALHLGQAAVHARISNTGVSGGSDLSPHLMFHSPAREPYPHS